MKRILIVVIIAIISVITYPSGNFVDLSSKLCSEYTVYTDNEISGHNSVMLMSGIYETKLSADVADEYLSGNSCQGISIRFNGSKDDIDTYLEKMKATKINTQEIDGVFIVYAINNNLKEKVSIDNENINIQIAINKGVVTIGYPLIIGAY